MNRLEDLLADKGVLLADGATGTNLFEMGLEAGYPPELWNDEHPERIVRLHEGFIEAGADIILTNSFGGNAYRLKLHDAQDRVYELNRKAAEIARQCAEASGRTVIVAGSVGPTGELFEPLGALTTEGAVAAFAEQMRGLKDGGVDVVWIETMSAAEEIEAAAEAARQAGLPYCFTASFDTAGRTMMGLEPGAVPELAARQDPPPVSFGCNCGVGASDLLLSVTAMAEADPEAVLVAKANCGIPQVHGDGVHYTGTPELMADYARMAIDAGARVIGGCCGTSPEHLAAMRAAIDSHQRGDTPTRADVEARIGPLVSPPAKPGAGEARGRRRARRSG